MYINPVFCYHWKKSIITKQGLCGYAVLKRFKMIGNEINHCRGKEKIKIFLRKENIKVDSESHLKTSSTLSKTEFQE